MKKHELNDSLSQLVKQRFAVAEEANRPHHERCIDCARQMDGDYFATDVEDDDLLESITMNITLPLINGFLSMLAEVLDPIEGQPFTLDPTPIAELPDEVVAELDGVLRRYLPQLQAMLQGDMTQFSKLRDALHETTQNIQQNKAAKAAKRLERQVRDDLIDANFSEALEDFLYNFLVYPTAIMKGPFYVYKHKRTWGPYGMIFKQELVKVVENKEPFDIYPAPHARDLQTCPYVIERMRLHSNDILDLVQGGSYDETNIDAALDDYDSYILPYACDSISGVRKPDEDDTTIDTPDSPEDLGYYDILIHYGQVRGDYLAEYGVELEDPRRMYEAEVWVLGDYVIRATLTPPGSQPRPFYSASLVHAPGKFWGKSGVEVVRDAQVQCTEAARALARNMRFSSGPIGEVHSDRVRGTDDPEIVRPHMLRAVKGDVQYPVYRFHTIPSHANELLSIYKTFSQEAYNLIGLPPLAYGNTQGAATLGRTSGGVAMVLNQASKPVKRSMASVERRVVKSLIQSFVDAELMFGSDPTLRGDVAVQVHGVQAIADKETKDGKMEWLLQSLTGAVAQNLVPRDVWIRLLRTIFEDNGIDTTGLPSFDVQDALRSDLEDLNGGLEAGGDPAPAPVDFLDGRSQTAINQIEGGM